MIFSRVEGRTYYVTQSGDDTSTGTSIQGAFAEGDTPEEAIFNCLDVLAMIRDYRANDNSLISFPNLELNAQNNVTITIPIAS